MVKVDEHQSRERLREGSQPRSRYGHHLLARHVKLPDHLIDAEVVEVLDDDGNGHL
jgi:hypothetical protein